MKLSVRDRILILNFLLPTEGDFLSNSIIDDFANKIEIKQPERDRIKLELLGPGNMSWDEKAEVKKDICFSKQELGLLQANIKKLDQGRKIPRACNDIAKRIADLNPPDPPKDKTKKNK